MNSLKKAELQKVLAPLVLQELQAQAGAGVGYDVDELGWPVGAQLPAHLGTNTHLLRCPFILKMIF